MGHTHFCLIDRNEYPGEGGGEEKEMPELGVAKHRGKKLSGQIGSLSSMDEVDSPGLWKGLNPLISGEMGQDQK